MSAHLVQLTLCFTSHSLSDSPLHAFFAPLPHPGSSLGESRQSAVTQGEQRIWLTRTSSSFQVVQRRVIVLLISRCGRAQAGWAGAKHFSLWDSVLCVLVEFVVTVCISLDRVTITSLCVVHWATMCVFPGWWIPGLISDSDLWVNILV